MTQVFEMEFGGRKLTIETGRLAKQARGSALVRYGDTVVLCTATMSSPREGMDFFPLLVDYEERMYAIGKIPGGWMRREGRPTEAAILSGRMIDRTIRPLFPDGFRNDVQVVATVLSVDKNNPPDIPAMIGASAALHISDIPFDGPVAGVRIGRSNGEWLINPTLEEASTSEMDLVVGGTKDAIMMVEAGANVVPEDVMLDAIMFGHEQIKLVVDLIEKMREAVGQPKVEVQLASLDPEVDSWARNWLSDRLAKAVRSADKHTREQATADLKDELFDAYHDAFGEDAFLDHAKELGRVFDAALKEEVRKSIVSDGIRPDGRALDEIRPISTAVGLLPRVHGTGLFQRGQTQVLTSCTLGLKSDEQILDDLGDEERKRYLHHYNFPGYSVGETRPMRGPGRREIGHGHLAERALIPVIPPESEFPYTLRLVSEVLESNGSSSMASVCGSTLALMDAGVPIANPVAGVAMGLVKSGDDITILTDIQGIEDALGDMDFKVAGTKDGVTALQMDIKIGGVSREILLEALQQAKRGRLFILERMAEAIAEPRTTMSPWAPRIVTLQVPVDKIRDIIGPGGKMIRKIVDQTGASIDIEDDGRVFVASTDETASRNAIEMIERLTKEVEVGAFYKGTVKRIMNFGAFVEILPGKEGLVHISKLANERVAKVEDVLNIGDEVLVKVTEIDKMGRINLSRKDALGVEQNNGNGATHS